MSVGIVEILRQGLGEEKVRTDEFTLKERRHDYWVLSQFEDMEGRGGPNPVCVVQPEDTGEVVTVVNACRETGTPLVPFGLGSGVCGAVKVTEETVLLDMGLMNRVLRINSDNLIAVFEAGLRGADAESAVGRQGMTLGHYPQSIDLSTVGGWVATRSAGQFSSAYGSIEDVVLGLEVVLPNGEVLETRVTPRSSAGPDLKQIFLGSEGTLGVITAVTFSLRWQPEKRAMSAFYASSMEEGFDFQRAIVQSGWAPPVIRQYDSTEAGRLFPEQHREDQIMILLVHEGPAERVEAEVGAVAGLAAEVGCVPAPVEAVEHWLKERNEVSGWEPMLKRGIILDTIEVAATWDRIGPIYHDALNSLKQVPNILTASAHSSHTYRSGLNLYFTFAARPENRDDMTDLYWECWRRTMEATVSHGGGISHHHGIGRVRRDWMERESGPAGVGLLKDIKKALDPANFMNPGVLIPDV